MAAGNGAESFERQWPEIERRLRRVLNSKAVAPWVRDDIVQETGARLLGMWEKVDQKRGPWALAVTIANNLLWDEIHRKQWREIPGAVPDGPDGHDVERASLARLELQRIKGVLPRLSHNYRSILLAEIGHATTLDGNPRALNMLRMRARQRLAALLDKTTSSLGITLPSTIKSGVMRLFSPIRRNPATGDAVAAVVAAMLATTTMLGGSLVPGAQARLNDPGNRFAPSPVAFGPGRMSDLGRPEQIGSADAGRVLDDPRRAAKDVKDKVDDLTDTHVDSDWMEARAGIGYEDRGDGATSKPRCDLKKDELGVKASCGAKVLGKEVSARGALRIESRDGRGGR